MIFRKRRTWFLNFYFIGSEGSALLDFEETDEDEVDLEEDEGANEDNPLMSNLDYIRRESCAWLNRYLSIKINNALI